MTSDVPSCYCFEGRLNLLELAENDLKAAQAEVWDCRTCPGLPRDVHLRMQTFEGKDKYGCSRSMHTTFACDASGEFQAQLILHVNTGEQARLMNHMNQSAHQKGTPVGTPLIGCGSKLNHQGFGPCCHLPGCHFGYRLLTHSRLIHSWPSCSKSTSRPVAPLLSQALPVRLLQFAHHRSEPVHPKKCAQETCAPNTANCETQNGRSRCFFSVSSGNRWELEGSKVQMPTTRYLTPWSLEQTGHYTNLRGRKQPSMTAALICASSNH